MSEVTLDDFWWLKDKETVVKKEKLYLTFKKSDITKYFSNIGVTILENVEALRPWKSPKLILFSFISISIYLSIYGHHLRRSGVFIINFEHICHLVLVFLLLTLSM